MKESNSDTQPMTGQQKRDYAKHLYLTEPSILQKELAERVGVSKNTISRWVTEGKWEELRASVVTSKATQLARLYRHLAELNDSVESRPPGERYVGTRDVDTLTKLTAAIRNLETETNIADKIEVGKEFLAHVRRSGAPVETVKAIATLYDTYIKASL
ncbi:MAG: phage terminase small subunit-related protein [Bacteroidales bacterium]|nr:phage terminase small subunit-related protein [Bacteroidales bacterium]